MGKIEDWLAPVYKFKVEKGSWSHYLLINETGKIIGIETGEH